MKSKSRTTSTLAALVGGALCCAADATTVTVRSDNFDKLASEASDYFRNVGSEPLSSWTEISARYKPVYFGGSPTALTGNARADQVDKPSVGGGLSIRSSNEATSTFLVFDNIITADAPDATPPTLIGADIVADQGTGPVAVNTLVTYTVYFSEEMDANTVEAADFGNAGTATITIGTITQDFPGEFTVPVTPTSTGTLRLQVKAAAVLKDVAGNELDTDLDIPADIAIPVGLISNSGFENPGPLNDGEFTENASGWSQGKYDISAPAVWIEDGVPAGYAGVRNPEASEYIGGAAAEGQNMGFAQTVAGFDIGMNQVLSTTLQANTQYGLSVKIGNPTSYNQGLTTGYRIELLAGGVLLQSAAGSSPVDGSTFITASLTHNSVAAPAQLGQTLEIRLLAINDGSDTSEVDFDDVQLTITGSASPYITWTGGPFLGTLTNTNAALDFDSGGLDTGIEWVVGGDPTDGSEDVSKAPTFDNTTDLNYFIYTYNRTDAANADTNTTIVAEYGSNLNGWTPAVHDGVNLIITATDNGPTDSVQVKIKRTLAVGGSIFARLNVVVAP